MVTSQIEQVEKSNCREAKKGGNLRREVNLLGDIDPMVSVQSEAVRPNGVIRKGPR